MSTENPPEPQSIHADEFDIYTDGSAIVIQSRDGSKYNTVEMQDRQGNQLDVGAVNIPDQLDAGTITLTGGVGGSAGSAAFDGSAATSVTTETQAYSVDLYISGGVAGSAYAYNYDWGHRWTGSSISLNFTVNWDDDPGSGANPTARWEINEV
jgi:hypothetical protein